MARLWKHRSFRVASVILPLLACVVAFVLARHLGGEAFAPTKVAAETERTEPSDSLADATNNALEPKDSAEDSADSASEDMPLKLASLETVTETLSQLVLAQGPPTDEAQTAFVDAEVLRRMPNHPMAVRAYIMLIENYPDAPQVKAADSRANLIIETRTEQQLDAIEASLPSGDDLTQVDSITVLGQFYFIRGMQFADSDPARAKAYFSEVCDLAWRVFQDKLDDEYKKTILDAYLFSADTIGTGNAVRAALSAHAETLSPCFTSWLIKAEIDGHELGFDYVKTVADQSAIRKYYIVRADAASDPVEKAAYRAKARDASLEILLTQPSDRPAFYHCEIYLQSAGNLGDTERAEAVATIEGLIKTQPLSIMRWIMRYELARYLTQPGSSATETRAGFLHLETMLVEAETGIVDAVVGDPTVDDYSRGITMLVLGHANVGTNRVDEAILHYDWVLDYFSHETHPGASAAYSLAVMHERKNYNDPATCISAYEQFVADHPSSYYAPGALMDVARAHVRAGDLASAESAYQRVKTEYWNTSAAKSAEQSLNELALQ